jgi:hypothetical protein
MKISNSEKAKEILYITNSIMQALEDHDINSEIAYSALGSAFSKMHFKLGKTIKDWEEITSDMVEIFNLRGEK